MSSVHKKTKDSNENGRVLKKKIKRQRNLKKKKIQPSFDQKGLKTDCGHFTGLWVEVHVILKKRNWVNRKKREKRREPETDPLSDGTGPLQREDQSCATRRRVKDYSRSIFFMPAAHMGI